MEAADMGDADAQYELGRNLRIEVRLDFTCHCYIIYILVSYYLMKSFTA